MKFLRAETCHIWLLRGNNRGRSLRSEHKYQDPSHLLITQVCKAVVFVYCRLTRTIACGISFSFLGLRLIFCVALEHIRKHRPRMLVRRGNVLWP
jgi:hypothetical protein